MMSDMCYYKGTLEEVSFIEEINTTILTVYPYDIDMKMVEKYMKETEEIVKHFKR